MTMNTTLMNFNETIQLNSPPLCPSVRSTYVIVIIKGRAFICASIDPNQVAEMARLVETLQTDLPTRVFRVTSGFNESLYLAANEPSLGMYRIQEHVQSNIPKVVDQKQQLQEVSEALKM